MLHHNMELTSRRQYKQQSATVNSITPKLIWVPIVNDTHDSMLPTDQFLCSKLNRTIAILHKLHGYVNQLYNVNFLPHVGYSCSIWGMTGESILKPMSIGQYKTMKTLHNLHRNPSRELYKSLKSSSINSLKDYQNGIFLYKLLQGYTPYDLYQYSHRQDALASKVTRNTEKFHTIT